MRRNGQKAYLDLGIRWYAIALPAHTHVKIEIVAK